MVKIVDLKLNIDGLILDDNQSVEDFVNSIQINSAYKIIWEVLYEETFE